MTVYGTLSIPSSRRRRKPVTANIINITKTADENTRINNSSIAYLYSAAAFTECKLQSTAYTY